MPPTTPPITGPINIVVGLAVEDEAAEAVDVADNEDVEEGDDVEEALLAEVGPWMKGA